MPIASLDMYYADVLMSRFVELIICFDAVYLGIHSVLLRKYSFFIFLIKPNPDSNPTNNDY